MREMLQRRWLDASSALHSKHGRFFTLTLKHVLCFMYPGADRLIEGVMDLFDETSRPAPSKVSAYFDGLAEGEAEALVGVLEGLTQDAMRGTMIRVRSLTQSGASEEVVHQVLSRQAACDEELRGLFQRAAKLEQSQSELVEIALKQHLLTQAQGRRVEALEAELTWLKGALQDLIKALYRLEVGREEAQAQLMLRREGLKALLRGEGEALRSLSESPALQATELPRLLGAGEQLCHHPPRVDAFERAVYGAPRSRPASVPPSIAPFESATQVITPEPSVPQQSTPQPPRRSLNAQTSLQEEVYQVGKVEFKLVQLPEKGFAIGQTQVTQALWEAVMGSNPSHFKGPRKPVEQVSWEDSVKFANTLSRKLGLTPVYSGDDNNARFVEGANGFRLPLEAEWEFAARGGENFRYAGSGDLREVGWCRDNSGHSTHDVAQLKPNAYGLYDMSGNVWEWCSDDYDNPGQHRPGADKRVRRGGSWFSNADDCAVASRNGDAPDSRDDYLGLRLSRSLA